METLEVVEVLPDSGDESDASSTGDMSRSFWTTQSLSSQNNLISYEPTQREQLKKAPRFGVRHLFVTLAFVGFANVYAMRVNLSVAIVAMVNNTAIHGLHQEEKGSTFRKLPTSYFRWPASSYFEPEDGANFTVCMADIIVTNRTDQDTDGADGPLVWTEKDQSIVLGCFFYGYVLSQLPAGYYAQKYGGKRIFGLGILFTAIFTLFMPIAARFNFYLLVIIRVLSGLAEGVTFPSMHVMLAQWVPPTELSRLATIAYAGTVVGAVVSTATAGVICDYLGWDAVFYISAISGMIWFIFWTLLVYDSPEVHPTITEGERDLILVSLGKKSTQNFDDQFKAKRDSEECAPVPWGHILNSKPVWALTIAATGQAFSGYLLLTEVPTFLSTILQFQISENAVMSALPYLLSFLLSFPVSAAADLLMSRNIISTTAIRKSFGTFSLLVPALAFSVLALTGCDSVMVMACLCVATGSSAWSSASTGINHMDLAPKYAGTLMGLTNGAANIMGFVAPMIVGWIVNDSVDLFHWSQVFIIASIVSYGSSFVYVAFGSAELQPWNSPPVDCEEESNTNHQGPLVVTEDMETFSTLY